MLTTVSRSHNVGRCNVRLLTLWVVVQVAIPSTGQDLPHFGGSVAVTITTVDAVVTDRNGRSVHGLKPSDFVVTEGRNERKITNFSEYSDGDPNGLSASTARETAGDAREARTVLIVFDCGNLTQIQAQPLFAALRSLIDSMRPTARVSVVTLQPGFRTQLRLSTNAEEVANVLNALELEATTRKARLKDVTADGASSDFFQEMASFQRSRNSNSEPVPASEAEPLRHVIDTRRRNYILRSVFSEYTAVEGKKAAILVSDQINPGDDRSDINNTFSIVEDIGESASRAGFTLYAVHPLGQESLLSDASKESLIPIAKVRLAYNKTFQERTGLTLLSEPSGGAAFYGPAAAKSLRDTVANDLNNYYSIGFQRARGDRDREPSPITVRVRDRSLRVRSRRLISSGSEEEAVRDRVVGNLFDPIARQELKISVGVGALGKPQRGKLWRIPITIAIPTRQLVYSTTPQLGRSARLSIFVTAIDGNGDVAPITQKRLSFAAPIESEIAYELQIDLRRADHIVSVAVLDEYGSQEGYSRVVVAVPSDVR